MTQKRVSLVFAIALAAVLTVLFPASGFSQAVAVAEVSGIVTDPSGSPVPGAQVTMVERETGFTRTMVTNVEGRYAIPNLPVGQYSLEVTAKGFKSYTQAGIILQVANNIELNVPLQLGAVSEKVEVSAKANMVETTDNSISQVVDQERVVDLPLNGRQPTDLVYLAGSSTNVNYSPYMSNYGDLLGSKMFYSSASISVAGGQGNGTNYLLDGGYNEDNYTNVSLPFPFPDALQEFSVETSSLPARYGLHAGGVVNAVTKSGSNSWHGDAFEFLRNGDLDARNFFASTHDTLKRNQFGGTLGGRIIRDKLFFFGGYQGTRNRQAPPQSISHIPTAAMLGGDFSAFESSACVSTGARQLIDPQTGLPFLGNQISTARFVKPALNVIPYLPTPIDQCGKVVYGIPVTGDDNTTIGRVDWVQSGKHSLYGRYFMVGYGNPAPWDPKNILVTSARGNLERMASFTLGDNYSISSGTLNAFHFTFIRRRDDRGPNAAGTLTPGVLGINAVDQTKPFFEMFVGSEFETYCDTCASGHFNTNTFNYTDDVDLIRGRHQITFGVNIMRAQANTLISSHTNGVTYFNGQFTGDAMADFFLGTTSEWLQAGFTQEAVRENMLGLYAQDTFRMNRKVTFNVGLRWEPYFPVSDIYGRGSTFNPAAFLANEKSKVFVNAPAGSFYYGDAGVPKSMVHGKMPLFSPRIGLAINPHGDGRDSIRIGAGIFQDVGELFFNELNLTNAPFASAILIPFPAGGMVNPWQGYPGGDPFPLPSPPQSNSVFPTSVHYVVWPNSITPTNMVQWNVSYQRQFGSKWLATINYLGSKSSHIWGATDLNYSAYVPGNTTAANEAQRRVLYMENPSQGKYYGEVDMDVDGGNATYNALLLSLEHRFSRGFTLLANYTWSHCISDYDFYGEIAGQTFQIPGDPDADRSNCVSNLPSIFNLSLVARSPVKGNSVADRILGNWQISPIIRATSGIPFGAMSGEDNSLSDVGMDRPNQVLSNPYAANKNANQWLNPAAFVQNAQGTFGNAPRDNLAGPRWFNFDLELSRTLTLREGLHMELRMDAFNVLNHPNLDPPDLYLTDPTFGQILSAEDPRILQFAVKLRF
jgi:hypothetical protein